MNLSNQNLGNTHFEAGSNIAKDLINQLTADKQRRMDSALNLANKKLTIEKELLAFYGELFDQNPDLWRKLTHAKNFTDEAIITQSIPSLLKVLSNKQNSIGVLVYYFKDIESVNKYPEVQLGWYQFSEINPVFETVMKPKKYFFSKPQTEEVFLHFLPSSHGLTEKGNQILKQYSRIKAGVNVFENEGNFIKDISLEHNN